MLNNFLDRKNKIHFLSGALLSGVIGFLSIPLLTWFYNVKDIGIYTIFVVLVTIITTLSCLALEQAFIREYYETDNKKQLLIECLTPVLLTFIVIVLISLFFVNDISMYVFEVEYIPGFLIIIYSSFLNLINRYYSILFRMKSESVFFMITQTIQVSTIICGSIFLYFVNVNLCWKSLIILHALSLTLNFLLSVFFILKEQLLTGNRVVYSRHRIKNYISYSFPLLVSITSLTLLSTLDKLMLKYFADSYQLGIYANALKIASALALLKAIISVLWTPTSMRWYKEKLPIINYEITLSLVCFLVIISYMIICISLPFLSLVIAPEFVKSLTLVPILLLFPAFYIISEITTVGILFSRKTISSIFISIFVCLTCIFACFMLIPSFGAFGASLSLAVSYLILLILRSVVASHYWVNFIKPSHVFSVFILIALCYLQYDNILNFEIYMLFLFICLILYLKDSINCMKLILWKKYTN